MVQNLRSEFLLNHCVETLQLCSPNQLPESPSIQKPYPDGIILILNRKVFRSCVFDFSSEIFKQMIQIITEENNKKMFIQNLASEL